jgi:peptidoglycan hydrolase-like protein with peptidoglycan-binding domain
MTRLIAAFFLAELASLPAAAAHRTPGGAPEISAASISASAPSGKNDGDPSLIAKAEVLLDRDHFSPGEIDGMNGDNYRRAIGAFQQANNLPATGILDADTWKALISGASEPVLKPYTITDADLAGPFDKEIPVDLKQMAERHGLSYTSPLAELAE